MGQHFIYLTASSDSLVEAMRNLEQMIVEDWQGYLLAAGPAVVYADGRWTIVQAMHMIEMPDVTMPGLISKAEARSKLGLTEHE